MQDLNNVARVSKRLYNNGTDPFLWSNFNLKVKFKKIESHRILFIAQTLGKVTKIERLRLLNTIDLCDNDLSSVNPEVLGTQKRLKIPQIRFFLFKESLWTMSRIVILVILTSHLNRSWFFLKVICWWKETSFKLFKKVRHDKMQQNVL